MDHSNSGKLPMQLVLNGANSTAEAVASEYPVTEENGNQLDYHLNLLLEVDATKALFQTAAKQIVDAIVPLATPLLDRFETVLEELQRRGADNDKLLATQTSLRRALSLKWGMLMIHELEQDPDHLKIVIPQVIGLGQKLFGPAFTEHITKTLKENTEGVISTQDPQHSRAFSHDISETSDDEEPDESCTLDTTVSGALNPPERSKKTKKRSKRKIRNELKTLPVETLDFEQLKIRFSTAHLLFAYHAEPVVRKELGRGVTNLGVRRKISHAWNDLEREQRDEWKASLQKLRAGDRAMLTLALSEDGQNTVTPTTINSKHRATGSAASALPWSTQMYEPSSSQRAQSETNLEAIKQEAAEQQLRAVPESSDVAATSHISMQHITPEQRGNDRVQEQAAAPAVASLPACKSFRPPSDERLLGAYEALVLALARSSTPLVDFLWCAEGVVAQNPSNVPGVVDQIIDELRAIAQHTKIKTQFRLKGEGGTRDYGFAPYNNKLRNMLLQAQSCSTSEEARLVMETHLEALAQANTKSLPVFPLCRYIASNQGRSKTVRVCHISTKLTTDAIHAEFRKFGPVKKIWMPRERRAQISQRFALVTFETPLQAQAAMIALHGSVLGDSQLHVRVVEKSASDEGQTTDP